MVPSLQALTNIIHSGGRIVVLTGAGISAESGIPTFRGPNGYWTVGSTVYRPEELATWQTFASNPRLVWPWYLWRHHVCLKSEPNDAHRALVRLEHHLGDRFTLVTQNVDGLHHRAGNSLECTMEIHGNINFYRCANGCAARRPIPMLHGVSQDPRFRDDWTDALHCPTCSGWMRPHVLWFDETYDEELYRFESAIRVTEQADALIVVGTTGATSLPAYMLSIARQRQMVLVDINPAPNPFAAAAVHTQGGWLQNSATVGMAAIMDAAGF